MIFEVKERIDEMKPLFEFIPRLDVLRTSKRSDSDFYIKRKRKALESAGIEFREHDLSDFDGNPELIIQKIREMNSNPAIHGILIQFPLGERLLKHFRSEDLMEIVNLEKDVDGFNPLNMINSMNKCENKLYYESCTPKAVMRLLREMEINLKGADVVLIGKSRVVGLPLLHQLLAAGSSVHSCHKSTENLAQKCRQAQILIVAAGSPGLVKKDWIVPGTIVIDIGVNYDTHSGKLIGGDVDYLGVSEVAGYLTPVPGGIGPLTIAALAENVLKSAIYHNSKYTQNISNENNKKV